MKLSKYSVTVSINEQQEMIYNTRSRQYLVYQKCDGGKIWDFLYHINKGSYDIEEVKLFEKLLRKGIVCRDSVDELEELRREENQQKSDDDTFRLTIFATNECNFRCVYCTQEHIVQHLKDSAADSILKLINKKASEFKKIILYWFGGEPLLELNRIKYVMEQGQRICEQRNCCIESFMTTNGYLLNESRIQQLKKLGLYGVQITIDGNKETHNTKRILAGGQGTYEQVLQNLILCLKCGIRVILRMNVSDENAADISELLNSIPKEYRSDVMVSIANIFQNEEKSDVFPLMKQVMESGYLIYQRQNSYVGCSCCFSNSVTIDTDGSLLLCTHAKEGRVGHLGFDGNAVIEETAKVHQMKTVSALDNPQCRDCIELPYCLGDCNFARIKYNQCCLGKRADGMSVEEQALLDYYYDECKERLLLQAYE